MVLGEGDIVMQLMNVAEHAKRDVVRAKVDGVCIIDVVLVQAH